MLSRDNSMISIDEIAKELEEIESKYSPKNTKRCSRVSSDLNKSLSVLSKEFDSLGLTSIMLDNPMPEILKQVVQSSRFLVQIHRNSVSQMKDQNIECRNKDYKKSQLQNELEECKDNLDRCKENCISLQNKSHKLNEEIKQLHKKEMTHKEELEKIKRYNHSKLQALECNIRKLKMENERLKEIFGKDIVTDNSTNEVALKLVKKYKVNEEIFKSTIKKLQENNRELLEDVLNLKEELILCHSKK